MKTPIEEEADNIAKNPSSYRLDPFPPEDHHGRMQEARRQVTMNWPSVFEQALGCWAHEKDLQAVISDDRYERFLRRSDENGMPLITLYLGREEMYALKHYIELTSYKDGMIPLTEEERLKLFHWKVQYIYSGIGIVGVDIKNYWRFV